MHRGVWRDSGRASDQLHGHQSQYKEKRLCREGQKRWEQAEEEKKGRGRELDNSREKGATERL
eukprot:3067804-Rhodomonas_salina.1